MQRSAQCCMSEPLQQPVADLPPNHAAAAQPRPTDSSASDGAADANGGALPPTPAPDNGGSPLSNGSPVKAAASPVSPSGRRRLSPEIELAPLDPPAPATPTLPDEAPEFR